MFLVIAYDIVSDRRRDRLVKLLKDYGGQRVNYSVFEFEIKKESFPELKKRIVKVINRKEDRVLCYELCSACRGRSIAIGIDVREEQETVITL